MVSGTTTKRYVDEANGRIATVVIEQKEELNPTIQIVSRESDEQYVVTVYAILIGAQSFVDDDN
jgi:DNA-directed RNA polymerase subunit beta'